MEDLGSEWLVLPADTSGTGLRDQEGGVVLCERRVGQVPLQVGNVLVGAAFLAQISGDDNNVHGGKAPRGSRVGELLPTLTSQPSLTPWVPFAPKPSGRCAHRKSACQ